MKKIIVDISVLKECTYEIEIDDDFEIIDPDSCSSWQELSELNPELPDLDFQDDLSDCDVYQTELYSVKGMYIEDKDGNTVSEMDFDDIEYMY